jgi:DNA-binding beta-propeller fold protein YncE
VPTYGCSIRRISARRSALAVSPDGGTVYAAVFHSGNQTTALSEGVVCDGGSAVGPCNVGGSLMPGGLPAPNKNVQNVTGPETGLIVRFENGAWRDRLGRSWNNAVRFSLPDLDVFAIDAGAVPVPVATASWAHVGTILYNMVVNPLSGHVYVSNTEARNEVRFEGPGGGGSTVQGHLHEARITVLDGATVTPHRLNTHIDYDERPAPAGVRDLSMSLPGAMAIADGGLTLLVAAFGSAKVATVDVADLESGDRVPDESEFLQLSAGGPSGLAYDENRSQLYVLTRFDDGISILDLPSRVEVGHVRMHNPEPPHVRAGRPFLYDAFDTTSNGESPCASCHVFGDFDSLAWDLGNPDGTVLNNPNPIRLGGGDPNFHPLKGPMATQSLRGMANHGPMHWRGDRTAGPMGDPLDEHGAFRRFIVAFVDLLGRDGPIADADMTAFANFILEVTYPPNPIRALDNSLTPEQLAGRDLYFGRVTDTFANCNGCHTLDPANGFFGGDGQTTFEAEPQLFKVPHLRNAYQKVGMFGMPAVAFFKPGDNGDMGDQVRGFGFLHDGSVDTLFRFHGANVFSVSESERRQLEAFVLAFDSNLAPIVGQQITLGPESPAAVGARIDLLLARAVESECDVVVKGTLDAAPRGWVRRPDGTFQSDRASEAPLADGALRAQALTPGQERTYTCVPPGSGERIGIDRDGDGSFDQTERDAGSDPADPTSVPPGVTTTSTSTTTTTSTTLPLELTIQTKALRMKARHEIISKFAFTSSTTNAPAANRIVPPPRGSPGDPRLMGGAVRVVNVAGSFEQAAHYLPPDGWKTIGPTTSPRGYKYTGRRAGDTWIRSVKIRRDQIVVKGVVNYSLDEPTQGRLAVRIASGLTHWCGEAAAKTSGAPPSSTKFDRPGKFIGQRNAPPPAACAPFP